MKAVKKFNEFRFETNGKKISVKFNEIASLFGFYS